MLVSGSLLRNRCDLNLNGIDWQYSNCTRFVQPFYENIANRCPFSRNDLLRAMVCVVCSRINDRCVFLLSSLVVTFLPLLDSCLLTKPVSQYRFINQGKTVIPGIDDGEQFAETNVSCLVQVRCKETNTKTRFKKTTFAKSYRNQQNTKIYTHIEAKTQLFWTCNQSRSKFCINEQNNTSTNPNFLLPGLHDQLNSNLTKA